MGTPAADASPYRRLVLRRPIATRHGGLLVGWKGMRGARYGAMLLPFGATATGHPRAGGAVYPRGVANPGATLYSCESTSVDSRHFARLESHHDR
ncbi:hypothetical protein FM112_04150 [Gulosibacter sp. 10]|nr:hypothetical protein FM112_04150 [Gulosibacter sp. 10]